MSKKSKNKKKLKLEQVAHKQFGETYELENPNLIFTPSKPKLCKINKHEYSTIKGADFGILTTSFLGASVALLIVVLTKITMAMLSQTDKFDISQFKFDLWALGISVLLTFCFWRFEYKRPTERKKLISRINTFFDE